METVDRLLQTLRRYGSLAAFKEPDIARACSDAAAEIQRLRAALDNIDGHLSNPLMLSKDEILHRVSTELKRVGMLAGGYHG